MYETPLVVARVAEGFVIELTYGSDVVWYRNIAAAGGCTVIYRHSEYEVDRIEPCSAADAERPKLRKTELIEAKRIAWWKAGSSGHSTE